MKKWLLAGLLPVALLLALPTLGSLGRVGAQEAGKGTLEGQLLNKTPGGAGVARVEVTLNIFKQEKQAGTQTTKTDAQGRFRFEGLDTTLTYQVVVSDYQGAEYDGDYLGFAPGKTTLPVEMAVYDPTTDGSTIKVEAAHVVIYVQEGSLLVEEFYQFSNSADKTYVGTQVVDAEGRKETLRFGLPSGASQVEIAGGLMECCIVGTQGGFVDTMGVAPGTKEISFAYAVPYSGGQHGFTKSVEYPTGSLNLFVQRQPGLQVSADQLSYQGVVQAQVAEFARYAGRNLERGTILSASLTGLPAVSSQDDLRWVALGGAVVVLAAFLVMRRLRRRSALGGLPATAATVSAPGADGVPTSAERQRELLVQLATLDDSYEAGVISEAEYQRRRARTKAELVALMGSLGKSGVT